MAPGASLNALGKAVAQIMVRVVIIRYLLPSSWLRIKPAPSAGKSWAKKFAIAVETATMMKVAAISKEMFCSEMGRAFQNSPVLPPCPASTWSTSGWA